MSDLRGAAVLWLALILVGSLGWLLQMRPSLVAEPESLSRTPLKIREWIGQDDPMDQQVEDILDADFHLARTYVHTTGNWVWVYVGYYGTARGGRPEHTPRGCYTGAGWGITETQVLLSDPSSGLRVQEYVVEREGDDRLVHFWYRSHRRTGMIGGLDQNLDRMLGRLVDGRADGALIRLSTPIEDGDTVTARGRLISFAAIFDPALGERWPEERPVEGEANQRL